MAQQGGVPYIGSRISLISKSEIRYEGTLYTINTEESTVALQNGKLLECPLPLFLVLPFVRAWPCQP